MKFKTHNDDKSLNANGTSYQGRLDIGYSILRDIFGNPKGPSGDGKVDAEWIIRFDNGVIATIYNYKNGLSYLGNEGTPTEEIRDWHIGGFNGQAADEIFSMFANRDDVMVCHG